MEPQTSTHSEISRYMLLTLEQGSFNVQIFLFPSFFVVVSLVQHLAEKLLHTCAPDNFSDDNWLF